MTSTCTRLTSRSVTPRVVVAGVVLALALAPSGAAFAQSEGPTTVRALIGGDGSVSEVERLTSDGSSEASADDLPLKMAISRSVDGDTTTTNYEVENTTATTKAVEYLDAAGNPGTAAQDVALPLVAELAVRLPSSRTDIKANGARITRLADGSSELVWSMVLFSPIGSPQQDVSFSAKGEGEPLARLDAMAVSPSGSPGLAATSQAANATVNGNAILTVVGNGANDGLLKLSDGVGKLLDGLIKLEDGANKLNAGLGDTAAPGAQKLADGATALNKGLKTASDGSKTLSDGLGSAAAGGGTLSGGLSQLAAGGAQLSAGLSQLNTSVQPLGAGSAQLAAGAAQLAAGLGDLKAGVDALPESIKSNPGFVALKGALAGVQAGIGIPTNVPRDDNQDGAPDATLLNGIAQLKLALSRGDTPVATPLASNAGPVGQALANVGVKQNLDYLFRILGCGTPSPFGNTCTRVSRSVNPIIGPEGRPVNDFSIEPEITNNVLAGVMAGIGTFRSADQPPTAEATLLNGLAQLQFGLSNPNCDLTDPTGTRQGNTKGRCGIKEIQSLISGGIDQLVLGISGALSPGVTQLATGSRTLADGQAAVAASAGPLLAGIAQLNAGSQTLSAGLGAADKGGKDLLAGLNLLNAGGKQLSGGLPAAVSGSGQIADGAQQLADGLGTAADGSGQIAEGLGTVVEGQTSVDKGLGDVREQAIEVLRTQFAQGTTLARQQLAGLEASTELIEETPGAANTTYVLTQSTSDIGFSTVSNSSDSGNLGRNIALGAGGLLLLMAGVAGGFLSGRRNAAGTHAAE